MSVTVKSPREHAIPKKLSHPRVLCSKQNLELQSIFQVIRMARMELWCLARMQTWQHCFHNEPNANVREEAQRDVMRCLSPSYQQYLMCHVQGSMPWRACCYSYILLLTEAGRLNRKNSFYFPLSKTLSSSVYCLPIFLPWWMLSRMGLTMPHSSCIHSPCRAKKTKIWFPDYISERIC